ncbi:MAG: RecX family transcriptional regulator [Clostridia bacterium]|nr:RecX family transcriptional regulator [Clostridia bacterium]
MRCDELYVIGGVREGERSITLEVIRPDGGVEKLRMTKKMWEKYAFSAADTVAEQVFREMKHDSEICEAVSRAASLVSSAPHSCTALLMKLRVKGFSEDAAETAVSVLLKRGYIDEVSQAKDIAERLVKAKHRGPSRVASELRQKGYSADIAAAATESVSEEMYRTALMAAAMKKARLGIPKDKKERDKMVAALVRQGFSVGNVIKCLENLDVEQ